MSSERLNASYESQLISNEMGKAYTCASDYGDSELTMVTLDFDARVQCFSSLSKSVLFSQEVMCDDDIKFWFPECRINDENDAPVAIVKERVQDSLECVIAMMMEGEQV